MSVEVRILLPPVHPYWLLLSTDLLKPMPIDGTAGELWRIHGDDIANDGSPITVPR